MTSKAPTAKTIHLKKNQISTAKTKRILILTSTKKFKRRYFSMSIISAWLLKIAYDVEIILFYFQLL